MPKTNEAVAGGAMVEVSAELVRRRRPIKDFVWWTREKEKERE